MVDGGWSVEKTLPYKGSFRIRITISLNMSLLDKPWMLAWQHGIVSRLIHSLVLSVVYPIYLNLNYARLSLEQVFEVCDVHMSDEWHIHSHLCMYVCMGVCMYVWMSICMYVIYMDVYVPIAIVVPSNIVSLPHLSCYRSNEHAIAVTNITITSEGLPMERETRHTRKLCLHCPLQSHPHLSTGLGPRGGVYGATYSEQGSEWVDRYLVVRRGGAETFRMWLSLYKIASLYYWKMKGTPPPYKKVHTEKPTCLEKWQTRELIVHDNIRNIM